MLRGLGNVRVVLLVPVAAVSLVLTIAAATAGAAQITPLPIPTTPAGETSNPTLENDRANYHTYLEEATTEAALLARQEVTLPQPRCREGVSSDDLQLVEALTTGIHPQIVVLKTELAEDGSLEESLLKKVGSELEAASKALQAIKKRAGACGPSGATPGRSGGPRAVSPGESAYGIVEILRAEYQKYAADYSWEFTYAELKREERPEVFGYTKILINLQKRMEAALAVHANVEALEKEFHETGALDGKLITETKNGVEAMRRGVQATEEEWHALS